MKFKLVWMVPTSHLDATKDAVFDAGAGVFEDGKYSRCAFQVPGQGQFRPGGDANPHIGEVGRLEVVDEYRVEVLCESRDLAKAAVEALKSAHPYEVPAYEVYKLEDI